MLLSFLGFVGASPRWTVSATAKRGLEGFRGHKLLQDLVHLQGAAPFPYSLARIAPNAMLTSAQGWPLVTVSVMAVLCVSLLKHFTVKNPSSGVSAKWDIKLVHDCCTMAFPFSTLAKLLPALSSATCCLRHCCIFLATACAEGPKLAISGGSDTGWLT
eukprot:scaffold213572_cov19-Tisochrysis_lutea.AAC.2